MGDCCGMVNIYQKLVYYSGDIYTLLDDAKTYQGFLAAENLCLKKSKKIVGVQ